MTPPKRIRLGHRSYRVQWDQPLDEDEWGRTNYNPVASIDMSRECPNEEQPAVLLHEIVHLIFHHFDIPENPTEEQVASGLERGISEVFARNPKVLAYLTEEFSKNDNEEE